VSIPVGSVQRRAVLEIGKRKKKKKKKKNYIYIFISNEVMLLGGSQYDREPRLYIARRAGTYDTKLMELELGLDLNFQHNYHKQLRLFQQV
jgi:hypothetical protein